MNERKKERKKERNKERNKQTNKERNNETQKEIKKDTHNDVDLLMQTYKYSQNKAEEVLKILTPEQIIQLREMQYTGGKQ